MRALVTGATGFIGNHLIIELLKNGWEIFCLVRQHIPAPPAGIVCIYADLSDPDSIDVAVEQTSNIDVIFHIGALLPTGQLSIGVEDFLITNTISTCRLLKIASILRTKAFVFASSLPVIGKPQDLPITEKHKTTPQHPYLLSKLAAELSCEMSRCQEQTNVISLRITSPYGPGMNDRTVLANFITKVISSKDIEIYGSGQRIQNFIHISDVIRAFLLAANTKRPGVYNIAGTSVSMLHLAEKIINIAPTSSKIIFSNKQDPQENYRWQIDMTKAHDYLEYFPKTTLDIGLNEYLNWQIAGKTEHLWYKHS